MTDIVTMVASISEFPTVEETDAILNELRRLSRDAATTKLIDDLLELRSLLGESSRGHAPSSESTRVPQPYPTVPDGPPAE
ncbi:hypothetical protein FF36_04086 [Frankia torreyi]|uniref:Uncharacterized protein n=1 Tax=Frankia torreyi TaxID=1856 RepID=A0A0D8BCD6_9ACTN|nr:MULTISPECIES: hypothetical protein [Frankia]KJE21629.1 hypothetical protein FF36_04086 [Frankia torreyi]KQM03680.1 hypothetical protein FF86_103618 [Frankia sp. CpI1-P]